MGDDLASRVSEQSVGDSALPLLSYLLDDMWERMVDRGDGVLRLPAHSLELGRILANRADAFLAKNPGFEEMARRVFALKLTTVRDNGEPVRRLSGRSEFSDEEWRLVTELANQPNRLLVTAGSNGSDIHVEVAHEALFRHWPRYREWISSEQGFLAWRGRLEPAKRAWNAAPAKSKTSALLWGLALEEARTWLQQRAEYLPSDDVEFIQKSIVLDRELSAEVRSRNLSSRRIAAVASALFVVILVGAIGWSQQARIKETWRRYTVERPFISAVRPYVLSRTEEQALKPGQSFTECGNVSSCPTMVVVPAGYFLMGSPGSEAGDLSNETPQHKVSIARLFAVSKFELTFEDWDTCVAFGDCRPIDDNGWGRGKRPVILTTWHDAQAYVGWLSKVTGKPYRLLTEAEYEYATRAGTQTSFPWGDEIGSGNANCAACGSNWDNVQTAVVGSFAPNAFGLYDMVGNVAEWVDDCYADTYRGAPADGSAFVVPDCKNRVVRGGSWSSQPQDLRSASRAPATANFRGSNVGFRVARSL
jgi:formylglycine-generating enzyme required for sulfatase activity